MALCVNLDAQAAMEELAEAVALAPNSFIAHLKMGELWMRLRVCEKAEDHTHRPPFSPRTWLSRNGPSPGNGDSDDRARESRAVATERLGSRSAGFAGSGAEEAN